MVLAIAKKFEDSELKGGNNFFVNPGWHHTMLTSVELADNLKGAEYPQDLLLKGVITKGDNQHDEFDIRLSINDDSPIPNGRNGVTWAKMAYKNLYEISQAVNLPTVPYSSLESLLKKPLMIEFTTKKGKPITDAQGNPQYNEDGTPQAYPDSSYAKKFKAAPAVAAGAPAAPAPATPRNVPEVDPFKQPAQPTPPVNTGPVLDDEIPF